jgi:hypothetical protein
MPDPAPIPKIMKAIADAIDTGAPIGQLEKVYKYKADVLRKVHAYVREGKGADDPVITKLVEMYTPKVQPTTGKYAIDGREKWGEKLNFPVGTDGNKPLKDIIKEVSAKYGIKPELLYASAMEEGLQQNLNPENFKPGKKISGFQVLGMDDLQEYVPKGSINYTPATAINEKGRKVNTGDFDNLTDALSAKAMMFNAFKGKVQGKLQERGVQLDNDDAVDFLTMQAYNAGAGKLDKWIDIYQKEGTFEGGKFLDAEPNVPYKGNESYVHSRRRYDPAKILREQKAFD